MLEKCDLALPIRVRKDHFLQAPHETISSMKRHVDPRLQVILRLEVVHQKTAIDKCSTLLQIHRVAKLATWERGKERTLKECAERIQNIVVEGTNSRDQEENHSIYFSRRKCLA